MGVDTGRVRQELEAMASRIKEIARGVKMPPGGEGHLVRAAWNLDYAVDMLPAGDEPKCERGVYV